MSTKVSGDVWEFSQSTGAARLVLVSLADNANDDGYAYPSIPTIAERCRVSVRSVFRYLAELEQLGELKRIERPGRSNVFVVTIGRTADVEISIDKADGRKTPAKLAPLTATSPVPDWHTPVPTVAHPYATAGTQNHHLTVTQSKRGASAKKRASPRGSSVGGKPSDDWGPSGFKDWV